METIGTTHETGRQLDLDIVEFERLREEIDSRTQISNNLVIAYFTALGAGFAFFDKVGGDLFLGLAMISILLWLMWMDHTTQIFKIGSYIGLKLASRIQQNNPGALGWEKYFRIIDTGGDEAAHELGVPSKELLPIMGAKNINYYIFLLFGAPTLGMLGLYGIYLNRTYQRASTLSEVSIDSTFRVVFCFVILLLWVYTFNRYRKYLQWISIIDKALAANVRNAEAEGGPQPATKQVESVSTTGAEHDATYKAVTSEKSEKVS